MIRKSKTKCVKNFECEVCHVKGMLQILTKNYARVRHYTCLKNSRPQFVYHRNSISYVNDNLAKIKTNPDQNLDQNQINHDRNLNDNGFSTENGWASSSGRIEHQPPKLVVVGSNPTPPAFTSTKARTKSKATIGMEKACKSI